MVVERNHDLAIRNTVVPGYFRELLSTSYGAGTIRPNYTAGLQEDHQRIRLCSQPPWSDVVQHRVLYATRTLREFQAPVIARRTASAMKHAPMTRSRPREWITSTSQSTKTLQSTSTLRSSSPQNVYNLFNRVQFNPPVNSTDNSQFGEVYYSGQQSPRAPRGSAYDFLTVEPNSLAPGCSGLPGGIHSLLSAKRVLRLR